MNTIDKIIKKQKKKWVVKSFILVDITGGVHNMGEIGTVTLKRKD